MSITINRYEKNPIITPDDIEPLHNGFEVIGAFNAGVASYGGETILLLRIAERPISDDKLIVKAPYYNHETKEVEIIDFRLDNPDYDFSDPRVIRHVEKREGFTYLTSLSYVRIARSKDGYNFTIDNNAFIYPFNEYQTLGIEDARCSEIEGKYYISFTSVSEKGVCDSLVSTEDFKTFEDLGNIFAPENKDVLLFPEKIGGKYYALHRPSLKSIGNPDIWIASSPDIESWGNHKYLMGIRKNEWDSGRIGGGLPPIKTSKGWLELYHGATSEHRYCMGAVLLDLNDPSKIIARSRNPIMEPELEYEKKGFFGDVVFGTGAVVRGDTIQMYYGVSDTSMAVCDLSITEILEQLK